MKIKLSFLGLAAFLLMGCASPNMKYSMPLTENLERPENSALIYFIRPQKIGYKVNAVVYDNDRSVGFVPYGQKLPYFVQPGQHLFMVVSESADFMTADIAPGKTYYIEVKPRMGVWRARFSLAPVTRKMLETDKVQKWISNARLIENTPEAQTWAAQNNENVLAKRNDYLGEWDQKAESNKPHLHTDDCE